MKVSKRFLDRARRNLRKYQKAFDSARRTDVGKAGLRHHQRLPS
jgi:hypothetical protein